MLAERILVLPAAYRPALGAVRDLPGLRAAADGAAGSDIWLRGLPAAGPLPLALRQLPARAAYAADAEGRLFPGGQPTPTGRLPLLAWQPLAEFWPRAVPTAALPGQVPAPVPVRLVPASQPRPAAALLTRWAAWRAYADTAPASRLARLRFAASGRGQALLLGAPLPPLPGQEYWRSAGLLLPAGFATELPLLARLMSARLNPDGQEDVLLFDPAGHWERIAAAHVQAATRAAVRRTPDPETEANSLFA